MIPITIEQYREGLTKLREIELRKKRDEARRLRIEIALRKIAWGTNLWITRSPSRTR